MNRHQDMEEEMCQSVCQAALESAKVTFINKAMENMEKQLNLWTHEITDLKKKKSMVDRMDRIMVRLKAKEKYVSIT